jgi:hypothetical protein
MRRAALLMGIALLPSIAADAEDNVDRQHMIDILRSLQAPIHDVELQYEGISKQLRAVDTSRLPDGIREANEQYGTDKLGSTYQGTFAYRDDRSVHVDLFDRPERASEPLRRKIQCAFQGKFSERILVPDLGGVIGPDKTRRGNLIWITREKAFLLVYLIPLIGAWLEIDDYDYEFNGWQTEGGHRCAVFTISLTNPATKKPGWATKCWVDLERGGHMLRSENYGDGNLSSRTTGIRLAQFEAEDKQVVWFPVAGRHETFQLGFEYSRRPVFDQTYEVLRGTLRINQGLKDERFSLDYGLNLHERPTAKRNTPRKTRGQDAAAQVAKAFEDAEKRGPELRASAPSQTPWYARNAAPLIVSAMGLGVFVLAGYLKRRGA